MRDLPPILAEIGIDAAEISRRQDFLSFDERDTALLKSLHDMLESHRGELTEMFYAHLLRFPEIRPLLGDEVKLARLKQAQAVYFEQLTAGKYDLGYVENRLHIGIVHQRVGLTPKWYMSAYCNYLSSVIPLVQNYYAAEPELAQAACRALLKVVFFDMGLALDTYFHAEQKALSLARSYTEQIVGNMPIGFIVLDKSGQVRLANNAVLRMFCMVENTSWQGKTLGELLNISGHGKCAIHDQKTRPARNLPPEGDRVIGAMHEFHVNALNEKIAEVRRSGTPCNDFGFNRICEQTLHSYLADISLARMGEDQVVLFMVQDITLRKQSEEEIHRLAFYDALTQLPNRRLLHERLMQSMSISARSGKFGALMFIDLDNFKTLNDTQGHDVGDLLLKEVAARLTRNVREGDTVARLGGDEFVVALESLSGMAQEAANQSETIAEKIRAELSKPYLLNQFEHHSSPSIGVSLFRGHQSSLEEVLKQADLAMYQAKSTGRNKVCFFDPSMQAEMELRARMEKDLRASIRLKQLELYYQMQVDNSGNIVGAEALVRWNHPEQGLVPPIRFIPLSEEIGMILPIGDWVIEQACMQLKKWEMDPAMRHIQLSVNVSPRQLGQPYFVEQLKDAIENAGIRPAKLKLELTESFILDDVEEAIQKMQELRAIGIRFAMDDFGTGYSSLAYLTRLPLEQLKIDQSFVRNMTRDKNSSIMVRTIINIANNFGMEVIAEGVETDDQLAFLRQYGCNKFQGYMFGKPIPLEDFERRCRT